MEFHLNLLLPFANENVNAPHAQQSGHFHNRGTTLPCLAQHFQSQSIFIHIRRNRYKVARSFTESMTRLAASSPQMKITPCIALNSYNEIDYGHPHVATCPRSSEGTMVELHVDEDDTWDALTTFQQFLWYVDEMEYRWYTLQQMFDGADNNKPRFIEVTWNNGRELEDGVNYVREELGCEPLEGLTNEHPHVEHVTALNCSEYLWLDLQYRKVMKFDVHHNKVLFDTLPQLVGGEECSESNAELEQTIQEYALIHGVQYNAQQWKFADEDDSR